MRKNDRNVYMWIDFNNIYLNILFNVVKYENEL